MNLRRGLMGLFVFFFLVSGIGFGLLVLDDQNDLSSRAATVLPGSLLPALPGEKLIENGSVWSGSAYGLSFDITFNKSLWVPPQDQDLIFFHLLSPTSVRVTKGLVDLATLKNLLGKDFLEGEMIESPVAHLDGWQLQTYQFSFFGTARTVDVWSSSYGISLIAVSTDSSTREAVSELVRGVSLPSQVKGIATPDDSARLAAVIRPSVVMILNNYCAQVRYTEATGAVLSGKIYPFCLAQAGSGFFVSQEGYIATNGHVVTNLPESMLIFSVLNGSLDNLLTDFFQVYLSSQSTTLVDRSVAEQKVKESHQSKETVYQMAGIVIELFKKNFIKLDSSKNNYYVQLGNTPLQLSNSGVNVGSDIVTATFLDADYQAPDPVAGFSSSDVALLKIDGLGYPALPLGSLKDVSVGSDILVVGFPGIVMGTQSQLLDTSANAEPTFTKGVVSSFKQAKGDRKNLVQTDASINHGNSGGPAVNSDGQVIGIATYGIVPEEGGGNYNFLRDIADLKSLMAKNKISEDLGETHQIWKDGLDNYWLAYLKYAKTDFEKVTSLYSVHPTAQHYLEEAESKIDTPEDKTPRFSRVQRKLYLNLSGGLMALSLLSIVILGISEFIDAKRRSSPTTLPPRPVQTF